MLVTCVKLLLVPLLYEGRHLNGRSHHAVRRERERGRGKGRGRKDRKWVERKERGNLFRGQLMFMNKG